MPQPPAGRLFRAGKAVLWREVAEILDRLGTSAEHWQARLETLSRGHLLGRFFATSRQRLREVAGRLGLSRVPNVRGMPGILTPHGNVANSSRGETAARR